MQQYCWFVLLLLFTFVGDMRATEWELLAHFENGRHVVVERFDFNTIHQLSSAKKLNGIEVHSQIAKKDGYWYYKFELRPESAPAVGCYLSLSKKYTDNQIPYGFDGPVGKSTLFRQSPHEPADHEMTGLIMQPIPMVALKSGDRFEIAISNSPVFYKNYTTQSFDFKEKSVALNSGDQGFLFSENGQFVFVDSLKRRRNKKYIVEPFYHTATRENPHVLDGLFLSSGRLEDSQLRQFVNQAVSKHWSDGKVLDTFGASVFSTSYMNLRVNETGRSKFWVIPAIDYANKQYTRDAFWISMVLPDSFALSCYENEAFNDTRFTGAERQLFTLVWAYRNYLKGFAVDTTRIRRILTIVEKRAPQGYYSGFGPTIKAGCWQGWADNLAFDEDDAITNNQGLYVVALKSAERMGVKPSVSIDRALEGYRALFRPELKGFSMSKNKHSALCVDALMGNLLAKVYLGEKLISDEMVLMHYATMKKYAKTSVGFKTYCNPDGTYLTPGQYNTQQFTAAVDTIREGSYQFGGSWYLYDMHMLIDAYLAGAKDAEDLMIWRTNLEFAKGNTTHEYIDTKTEIPHKPNMGWNAGIYGIWQELIRQGKATDRFLKAINPAKND